MTLQDINPHLWEIKLQKWEIYIARYKITLQDRDRVTLQESQYSFYSKAETGFHKWIVFFSSVMIFLMSWWEYKYFKRTYLEWKFFLASLVNHFCLSSSSIFLKTNWDCYMLKNKTILFSVSFMNGFIFAFCGCLSLCLCMWVGMVSALWRLHFCESAECGVCLCVCVYAPVTCPPLQATGERPVCSEAEYGRQWEPVTTISVLTSNTLQSLYIPAFFSVLPTFFALPILLIFQLI